MKRFLKYLRRFFTFIGITLAILIGGAYAIMWILVNGPSTLAKDLFVLSVKETSAGGFLANIYLSEAEIAKIQERNSVKDTDEITDTSIVVIDKNNGGNQSGDNSSTGNDGEVFVDGVRFEMVIG